MNTAPITQAVALQAASAKKAGRALGLLSGPARDSMLRSMAAAIRGGAANILFHNEIDVEAAREAGLSSALIDRLTLTAARVEDMARALEAVAGQSDPVGEAVAEWSTPDGLKIRKTRVPLGVVAMIFESRPNVTVDAAGLCVKAGNAVILRGGSEAMNSNRALAHTITEAAEAAGMPAGAIQFIDTTDREAVSTLVKLDSLIDLIIPRGGADMVRAIREQATVPVLAHGSGLCHTYIDRDADLEMAVRIAVNAKCQRPGVCNAMETLLVHQDIAPRLLPRLCEAYARAGVEIRGCSISRSIVQSIKIASDTDYATEHLELTLSLKVVASIDEAMNHIARYGSGHSEAIVTGNNAAAERFLREVDAAAVFHNASTRLHDGGAMGLGAEIGISTNKLHARGTMGARELTTTKYIVTGTGQIRE